MKKSTNALKNSKNDVVEVIHIPEKKSENLFCQQCSRYDQMGFGAHCPCDHKDPQHLRQSGEYKMRNVGLYQLYDLEAECSAGPIYSEHSLPPAIRKFHAIFTREGTLPYEYPQHFVLRYLGIQDETTGAIKAIEPTTVATGAAWQAQQENK